MPWKLRNARRGDAPEDGQLPRCPSLRGAVRTAALATLLAVASGCCREAISSGVNPIAPEAPQPGIYEVVTGSADSLLLRPPLRTLTFSSHEPYATLHARATKSLAECRDLLASHFELRRAVLRDLLIAPGLPETADLAEQHTSPGTIYTMHSDGHYRPLRFATTSPDYQTLSVLSDHVLGVPQLLVGQLFLASGSERQSATPTRR